MRLVAYWTVFLAITFAIKILEDTKNYEDRMFMYITYILYILIYFWISYFMEFRANIKLPIKR